MAVSVLAIVTVVSLVLRVRTPMWLLSDLPYDDALMARLAGELVHGQWLGPYDGLILSKGPAYPIFVAVAYKLHLPLLLADQLVHLVAAAIVALAAWRLSRSMWLGISVYALLALDPTYFGALGIRVSRETLYESLALMLVGGTILFLTEAPGLMARGLRWAVPVIAGTGVVLGVVGAGYYMCREERVWIGPAVAVAAVAGAATWQVRGRAWQRPAAVSGAVLLVAFGSFAASVHWVTARNQVHYGAAVVADMVDGEFLRAYAQWQRVDVGEHGRWVPVSWAQRQAVYSISPSAAELAPWLDGPPGHAWFSLNCVSDVCTEISGGDFVWAMRNAAIDTGHMDSAGEAQRFFGRIADDVEEACGHELPCDPAGVGLLPPMDRIRFRDTVGAAWSTSVYFLSFESATGQRPWPSSGNQELWDTMTRPLRGVDRDMASHLERERRAEDDQWPESVLDWLYRWGGRVGGLVALGGLGVAALTRTGRRHGPVAIAAVAMLLAVLGRVLFIALLDGQAYPAARSPVYLLPGFGFYFVFVALGTWLVIAWVRNRRKALAMAAHVPPPAATASSGDGAEPDHGGGSPASPELVAP